MDYPLPQPQRDLALRLDVALHELYLKCAIRHGYERFPLPLAPDERAFVRKRRYDGEVYTTALWFSGGHLRFADLGDPAMRDGFEARAARWGVDYGARFEELLDAPGRKEEPASYELIVGRDLFVAIEDLEERVLYDYDEIERRRREQTTPRPINDFKLVPRRRAIRMGVTDAMLRRLEPMGAPGAAARSAAFHQRALEYDRLLDEIGITHPTISFRELTSGAWMGEIARIFGKSRDDGKHHRRTLLRLYNKLGLFLSERGGDVQLYQGIWHDEANAFVVGAPTSMNLHGQENAHLLRRFHVLQGLGDFDREEHLAAMAVQFVRPRQYTVLPYYFHLIDLYVENVRRYETRA